MLLLSGLLLLWCGQQSSIKQKLLGDYAALLGVLHEFIWWYEKAEMHDAQAFRKLEASGAVNRTKSMVVKALPQIVVLKCLRLSGQLLCINIYIFPRLPPAIKTSLADFAKAVVSYYNINTDFSKFALQLYHTCRRHPSDFQVHSLELQK